MAAPKRWYVKSDTRITGPFPTALITRDIVLGRLRDGDCLSPDGAAWYPYSRFAEFKTARPAAPGSAEFARYDEREGDRRRDGRARSPDSDRREDRSDRRRFEGDGILTRRANARIVWQSLANRKPRTVATWLTLACACAAALYLAVNLTPRPQRHADCSAVAQPRVNWMSCGHEQANLRQVDLSGARMKNAKFTASDLAGATLVRADFAYADLAGANLKLANLELARLVGVNLRGADLTHANLQAADLQYADLRQAELSGAELRGARLGNAIWVDGRTCGRDSVGRCAIR